MDDAEPGPESTHVKRFNFKTSFFRNERRVLVVEAVKERKLPNLENRLLMLAWWRDPSVVCMVSVVLHLLDSELSLGFLRLVGWFFTISADLEDRRGFPG